MTPKKRAELLAARVRGVVPDSASSTGGAAVTTPLPTARDRAAEAARLAEIDRHRLETLPSWDAPHLAGRLDSRRRLSLFGLDWIPPHGALESTVSGPWVVLETAATIGERGCSAIEGRTRGTVNHPRLRLSAAVAERLGLAPGDLVLVFTDEPNMRLFVTSPAVLAAATFIHLDPAAQ